MKLSKEKQKALVKYWATGSEKDFTSAGEIVSKTSRFSSGLFFMHLSVEKILKALYVKKFGVAAPFSHNLMSLAAKCELDISSAYEKILLEINEYNLESRYPDEKFSLEKRATKKYALLQLTKTTEILKWISQHLSN